MLPWLVAACVFFPIVFTVFIFRGALLMYFGNFFFEIVPSFGLTLPWLVAAGVVFNIFLWFSFSEVLLRCILATSIHFEMFPSFVLTLPWLVAAGDFFLIFS